MDEQLLAGDFSRLSRAIIWFTGELCVASTGAVTPNQDLYGKELQRLYDLESKVQGLLVGVVSTSDGGAVVFSWPADSVAADSFVRSLLSVGLEHLPSVFVQFLFAYVENTYFSPEWWNSLTDIRRRQLEHLAAISNA